MSDALAQRLRTRAVSTGSCRRGDGPARVRALFTTRNGGVATGARATLDSGRRCRRRRPAGAIAKTGAGWRGSCPPIRCGCRRCTGATSSRSTATTSRRCARRRRSADAAVTRAPGIVLTVRTADCLPVLFADRARHRRRASRTPDGAGSPPASSKRRSPRWTFPARDVVAWIGPAIGPRAFEVGARRVRGVLRDRSRCAPRTSRRCARASGSPTCRRSRAAGSPRRRDGGRRRTVAARTPMPQRFFSYRRDRRAGAWRWSRGWRPGDAPSVVDEARRADADRAHHRVEVVPEALGLSSRARARPTGCRTRRGRCSRS